MMPIGVSTYSMAPTILNMLNQIKTVIYVLIFIVQKKHTLTVNILPRCDVLILVFIFCADRSHNITWKSSDADANVLNNNKNINQTLK